MSRVKKKIFHLMYVAVALTVAVSLGACADKKAETLPDEGVQTQPEEQVSSSTLGLDEQTEARDPGFTDSMELNDVYFDFDKSDLRADTRDALGRNAEWIVAHSGSKVQIEGHCDERGTEEYNLALGERRANSVKNYLITLGVEPDRLYTISYGEELPADPRHTEEAWAKNRRAHFLITQ